MLPGYVGKILEFDILVDGSEIPKNDTWYV